MKWNRMKWNEMEWVKESINLNESLPLEIKYKR
jgi:hypothetical protein